MECGDFHSLELARSLGLPIRYRSLMVLAAVLFGQLLLMAYQLRRNQDVPLVRHSVVYLVAPIQRGASAVVRSVRGVWEGYVYLWGTRRQNQSLVGQMDKLKMENQRLREQAEEGRRLQVLFNLREQVPPPTVAAQVLSTGASETARIVLIDKGANAGLKPDLAVMVADGIVGKVLHVFPNTAQVLLVTDPYSGVACLLEGSRVHGILKGQNKPVAILWYVPNGETGDRRRESLHLRRRPDISEGFARGCRARRPARPRVHAGHGPAAGSLEPLGGGAGNPPIGRRSGTIVYAFE